MSTIYQIGPVGLVEVVMLPIIALVVVLVFIFFAIAKRVGGKADLRLTS